VREKLSFFIRASKNHKVMWKRGEGKHDEVDPESKIVSTVNTS
jgi:hypothetical protein